MLYNINVVWVWLSLVEYLNGVQGVGGSNPLTQTSFKLFVFDTSSFFIYFFINEDLNRKEQARPHAARDEGRAKFAECEMRATELRRGQLESANEA